MVRHIVLLILTALSGAGQLGGLSLSAREVRQSFQTLHFTGSKSMAQFFDEATPLRLWRVRELLQELEDERQPSSTPAAASAVSCCGCWLAGPCSAR